MFWNTDTKPMAPPFSPAACSQRPGQSIYGDSVKRIRIRVPSGGLVRTNAGCQLTTWALTRD